MLLYLIECRAMIGTEFARIHPSWTFQALQALLLHLAVLAHLEVCTQTLTRIHLQTVVIRQHHRRKVEDLCRMWVHQHHPFILLITEDLFVDRHLIGIF